MANVNSGMKFAWDAVPGATSYDFQIRNNASVVVADRPDLSVLEITVADACAGLVLNTPYYARVRAKDSFGPGAWSTELSFTIVGVPAPGNLRTE